MLDGIVLFRGWLFRVLVVTAMTGCSDAENPARNALTEHDRDAELQLDLRTASGAEILRVREDAPRKRLWVLTPDEVRVYDTARMSRQLIRKIALPRWSVISVRHVCMPDMILDATGSAFVSSNAQARLLRIDVEIFNLQDYEINFPATAGRDNGFGALAFGPDGTLQARTTLDGLLWKIDIAKATAIMVEGSPETPSETCAITTQRLTTAARSLQ